MDVEFHLPPASSLSCRFSSVPLLAIVVGKGETGSGLINDCRDGENKRDRGNGPALIRLNKPTEFTKVARRPSEGTQALIPPSG